MGNAPKEGRIRRGGDGAACDGGGALAVTFVFRYRAVSGGGSSRRHRADAGFIATARSSRPSARTCGFVSRPAMLQPRTS